MASLWSSLRTRFLATTPAPTVSRAVAPPTMITRPASIASFSTSPSLGMKKMSKKQKKEMASGIDLRMKLLRYHRDHGALKIVPRPLSFPRLRALRHWTITKAWRLYTLQKRTDREANLQRLNMSMYDACEELRLMDGHGRRIGVDVESNDQLEASIKKAMERENAARDAAALASSSSSSASSSPTAAEDQLDQLEKEQEGAEAEVDSAEAVLPLDKQIGKLYRKAMSKKGVWRGFPIEAARIQTDFPPTGGWNSDWKSV